MLLKIIIYPTNDRTFPHHPVRESIHASRIFFSSRPPWLFTAIHGGLHPADIPTIQVKNLRGLFLTPCRFRLPPWKTDHGWTGTAGHPCRFRRTEKPSVTLSEAAAGRLRSAWRPGLKGHASKKGSVKRSLSSRTLKNTY